MKNADWFAALPWGAKPHDAPPPLIVTVALPCPVASGPVYDFMPGVTVFEAADAGPVPMAVVAVTVQETATPLASPVTVIGEPTEVAACVPQVAVYDVIGEPPSEAGGENATVARASPGMALTASGAPGSVTGVTLAVGAEAGPVPATLVAATVQETATPLVRPLTVSGETAPVVLFVPHVAVYAVIGAPPVERGAAKATVTCALPGVAVTPVGASGTVAGVTLAEGDDGALVPTALVAVTVHVTAVPFVRPATTMGEPAPEALCAPQVAAYEVIGVPPVEAGAVNETVTWPFPRTADTAVGEPGGPSGVTVLDGVEAAPVPAAVVAVTVQLTAVPLASPVTTIGEAGPDALCGPHVAVYVVTGKPPVDAGAVKETVTCALPATAPTPVGAPGTVAGVTLLEGADAGLVPTAFVAVTVQVTGVPLVSPVTTSGEAVPVALCAPHVAV